MNKPYTDLYSDVWVADPYAGPIVSDMILIEIRMPSGQLIVQVCVPLQSLHNQLSAIGIR